jgi:DNA-binding NarL/FixJ family response regulator/DNA invertase Pin-like site-specific DNA recombinase
MISHHGRPAPPPKSGHTYEVLIYRRVSIAEERTGGHTLDTQQTRTREQFDALYGTGHWNMTVLEDDGVSGRYGTHGTRSSKKVRKGLLACAQALDNGRFDDFAVYNLSRLARDNVITEEFLKEHVVANGTAFHSATEDIDLTTSQGWLIVRVTTAINANQREGIALRNKDAAAFRVEEGYYMGQVGYGWQWAPRGPGAEGGPDAQGTGSLGERRRILPIPEQGKWVVWMKDRYLAGWSPRKIVGELNALGVPTPESHKGRSGANRDTPGSGKWIGDVALRILLQPTHAGLLIIKDGRTVEGEFAGHRYFDPDVRESLLTAKASRKKKFPTNTAGTNNAHLLSGLIVCARCGKRLYPSSYSDGKYSVFRCFGGHTHGARTCPNIVAKEGALETAVLAEIERLAQDAETQRGLFEEAEAATDADDARLRAEAGQLNARLAQLDAQFLQWADMATQGGITMEGFAAFNAKLTRDRAETDGRRAEVTAALAGRAQREAFAAHVRTLLMDFPAVWGALEFAEQREVLTQLIERLALDKAGDGTTALLTVKLALLPERTFALSQPPADRRRKFSSGVAALTARQLALLYWADQGKGLKEIATLMRVTVNCLGTQLSLIRKHLGIHSLPECAAKARGRVHAERSTLPLEGMSGPTQQEGAVSLSPSILEVLPLFASGAQTKEIAGLLKLPETTVAGRRTRMLQAFGARTVYEAVQQARQQGLL